MARKGSGQTVITAAEQVQVGKSIEVLLLTSVRYVTICWISCEKGTDRPGIASLSLILPRCFFSLQC
ncbi:MAG: hypothetical protein D3914_08820 [Candidatus Electrothrix sp. LOE2]|nr:hypothetical protein [Candidatus Electrothrix sp. LOE2]